VDVQVLTVSDQKDLIESKGIQVALKEVDVATIGSIKAMCSLDVVINIEQPDSPIKIKDVCIDGVPVSHPRAVVDLYMGSTQREKPKSEVFIS
jgi:uncharacterized protein (DUF39 family)